jgi:hypothetical protein
MSDISQFVTGLSNAVSGYMGQNYKSQLDTQQAITVGNNQTMGRMAEDSYKQGLEGTVSPDTADKMAPGLGIGDAIKSFAESNKRNPTTKEFGELLKGHPKAASMSSGHSLSVPSFLAILKNTPGVDQNQVSNLAQDLQKQGASEIPIGIGEAYLNGLRKDQEGVSDSVLNTILTGDETFSNLPTVQEKMSYISEIKSAMKEPGKQSIKDEDLDKVLQGTMTTYQHALKDPKQYPNPVAAVSKELSKRYNKASVNRVLLKLASLEVDGQGNVQAPAQEEPQAPSLLSKLKSGFLNNQ